MKLGDRAKFFDAQGWRSVGHDIDNNDIFYRSATVVNVYERDEDNRELVDLVFDHRNQQVSRGHFSDGSKPLDE